MFEIFKEFTFDAAHHLGNNVAGSDHPYARLHGHSFVVTVVWRGERQAETHWVEDFAALERALLAVKTRLDHHLLNEIEGLELPTVENICLWIWDRLKPQFPTLYRVTIRRGTLGEGCAYEGPRG